MKECWINVYQRGDNRWYGNIHESEWRAKAVTNRYCIYRIHVRMK